MPYFGQTSRFNRDTGLVFTAGSTVKAILGDNPYNLANLNPKTFLIHNRGGSFTDAVLEFSPDGANWGTYSGIGGGTLGSTVWKATIVDKMWKFWRIGAAVVTGVGSAVVCWQF